MANKVPETYFCSVDHTGQRTDKFERPELHRGCYEFLAPDDYTKN